MRAFGQCRRTAGPRRLGIDFEDFAARPGEAQQHQNAAVGARSHIEHQPARSDWYYTPLGPSQGEGARLETATISSLSSEDCYS